MLRNNRSSCPATKNCEYFKKCCETGLTRDIILFQVKQNFQKSLKIQELWGWGLQYRIFFQRSRTLFLFALCHQPQLESCTSSMLEYLPSLGSSHRGLRDWSDTNWQPPSWDCEKCDAIGKRRPFTFFKINTCLLRKNTSKKLYAWTIPLYCFQLTKWAKAEK